MPRKPSPRPRSRKAAGPRKAGQASTSPPSSLNFPVVGLGGSAGGFEALLRFFKTVPEKPGMAFLVVLHLDPTRTSELPELLGNRARLPVSFARDGEPIRENRVYVIPPNAYLTVQKGKLRLGVPHEPRGLRLAVDTLLRSLADEARHCAVGVILSGNGADGTMGLRAIKEAGGLALVQDPASAEYDSMPRTAIASGVVDYVLPVEKIVAAIRSFAAHDYVAQNSDSGSDSLLEGDEVRSILSLLYLRRNVDFSEYKKGTITRRIHRRMGLLQLNRVADYLKHLRENPKEVEALFGDLLIQVTQFFREPQGWVGLERGILARLVNDTPPHAALRAWVPGCATGEEAYSLAILLVELKEKLQRDFTIQIFASDLDAQSLDIARRGWYGESAIANLSPERLSRFFDVEGKGHRVKQFLRDVVIFSQHNVLVDPPFSKLDLISCRNLLIYFEPDLQNRVLQVFHFSLKPGRFLVLGSSETTGSRTDLFQPVSRKEHIFRRVGATRATEGDGLRHRGNGSARALAAPLAKPAPREDAVLAYVREQVLKRHVPAAVVINRKMEIVSLFGPTQDYMIQPSGPLTADLMAWARDSIRSKLRLGVQSALRKEEKTEVHGTLVEQKGGQARQIVCTVEPLGVPVEGEELFLIVFREEPKPATPRSRLREPSGGRIIKELEYELQSTRDELRTSVEQLESSNEELRATNEEILSVNEELQSTNEELETSQEELQSVNEELNTVNNQLELKIVEVEQVNDDLVNLLGSLDAPILFLDRQLRIRRFTAAVTRLFRLIGTDIGRPLQDIANQVSDAALLADAEQVLSRLVPVEKEIAAGTTGFLRRILPYRTAAGDRIEGVVVIYTDISDRMQAAAQVREARDFAEAILETLREPLLLLDENLAVLSANRAFFEDFKIEPSEVVGRRIYDIGQGEWGLAEFRRFLDENTDDRETSRTRQIRQEFARVGERVLLVNLKRFVTMGSPVTLVAISDITSRTTDEDSRNDTLRQMVVWEEKERHRLALELHDEAGQHVTAFMLGLAALRGTQKDPTSQALLQQLHDLADELAQRLHGLSLQLRPTALDQHGLPRAVQSYLEDMRHRHQIDTDFQVVGDGIERLPSHLESMLYRVTQESLTNVLKHASATKVSVVIDRRRDEVQLVVEDNGRGFLPAAVATDQTRLGLRGMAERVQLAGGQFSVESQPGKGTTVFARVPLDGRRRLQ